MRKIMGLKLIRQNRAFGVEIDQLYLRLAVYQDFDNNVTIYVKCYASKEAYKDSPENEFRVDGIQKQYRFKGVDITDAMDFAHKKIIEELSTDKTEQREFINVDENGKETSEIITIIVKEKFVDKNNITNEYNSGATKEAK